VTREETLAIMGVLKAAYPNYYRDMNRKDAEAVVDLWATMFNDEPMQLVAMAVKAHIASDVKGFPPHIGAIKEAIVKLQTPNTMSELEAWALVSRAASNAPKKAAKGRYEAMVGNSAIAAIVKNPASALTPMRLGAAMGLFITA
jgi:hypothetical protein